MVLTNPYTYNGPGTRWADQDATTTSRLNIARINADWCNHAIANSAIGSDGAIVAEWDDPAIFQTGANYMAFWVDFTDTALPKVWVKFGVAAVPVPGSITDGIEILKADGGTMDGSALPI